MPFKHLEFGSSPERLQALFIAPTSLRHIPRIFQTLVSIFIRIGLTTASLHRSPPFGLTPQLPTPNSINLVCPGGIPSDIIDTRDTTDIIDTPGTIGVYHPAPFGIFDILDH